MIYDEQEPIQHFDPHRRSIKRGDRAPREDAQKIHTHEDHEAKTNAAQERRRVRVGWFRNDDTGETTPVYDTVPRPFGKNV